MRNEVIEVNRIATYVLNTDIKEDFYCHLNLKNSIKIRC